MLLRIKKSFVGREGRGFHNENLKGKEKGDNMFSSNRRGLGLEKN